MRIVVTVKTGAKIPFVKEIEKGVCEIAVREPAHENRANIAIQKALADYFGIAPSQIQLARGQKNKRKVFDACL
ncbi:DUF167 domain-containing protein [Candidatus Uhrbacteria bacterium]|nr:DUF167 domain-containing protein [Candidatus Uhrbacteria bacterium]